MSAVTFALAGTPGGGEDGEEDELEDEELELEELELDEDPEDGVAGCVVDVPDPEAGALDPPAGCAGACVCGIEAELLVAGDPPQPTHDSSASEVSDSSRGWRIVDERGNSVGR